MFCIQGSDTVQFYFLFASKLLKVIISLSSDENPGKGLQNREKKEFCQILLSEAWTPYLIFGQVRC